MGRYISPKQTWITDPNQRTLYLEENGGVPVNVQDQTTPPFACKMYQKKENPVLTADVNIGDYELFFAGGTTVVGDSVILVSTGNQITYTGTIVAPLIGGVLMDTPVNAVYTVSATTVFVVTNNMAVEGHSAVPEVFEVQNICSISIDVTRVLINILGDGPMDDGMFGSIPALSQGLVFRKQESYGYTNYWNVKTNGELGELSYDKMYDDKASAGQYGFTAMITYAGQANHGVALRLQPQQSIEVLIQDDLTGLDKMSMIVEGHRIQE